MELALIAAPLLVPVLGFIAGYMLGGRRLLAGVAGATVVGVAGGAFLGSAAAALSTMSGLHPTLRGAAAGAVAGLALGLAIAAFMELNRRRKT